MKDCTTAVVLAAGRGSRMQRDDRSSTLDAAQLAAAGAGIKSMIPDSRGRPFIDHILSSLADEGIRNVALVVAPEHTVMRQHFDTHPPQRLAVDLVVQSEPTGTAHAILAAEPWVAGRDFLALNADNLYPPSVVGALVALGEPGMIAFERDALIEQSNIDQERVGAFATVAIREDGMLDGIVEKPGRRLSDALGEVWISMNIWRFDAAIFDACRDVSLSPRGEYELPMAVGLAISRGMRLRALKVHGGVLDLSHRADIATVARDLGSRDIRT